MGYLLFIFAVFLASVSQLLLKVSANKIHKSFINEYLNIHVIFSYTLFLISSFLVLIAYRYIPYSSGPIIEMLGYIIILILSYIFLNERLERKHFLGMTLILIGIVVFNWI